MKQQNIKRACILKYQIHGHFARENKQLIKPSSLAGPRRRLPCPPINSQQPLELSSCQSSSLFTQETEDYVQSYFKIS